MNTLVDLLRDAASRFGSLPAVSCRAGLCDRVWSYQELWGKANAVAGFMRREHGLAPGTPVVVWAPNSPQLVATYFGVMLARLILVPIDPTATVEFAERVSAVMKAALVITDRARPMPTNVLMIPLDTLPDKAGSPFPEAPAAGDVAEIVFTSGTTGAPKGVILTHRNILANVHGALQMVPHRPLRLVSILPLSHMLEQTVGLYAPLVLGSTIHYPASHRAPILIKAMRRQRVEAMVLVPEVLELMMRGIEQEVAQRGQQRPWQWGKAVASRLPMRYRRLLFAGVHRRLGGHLDFVISGGARLPEELLDRWERLGIRVIEGYGATECAPIVAANSYWDRVPGTVGRMLPGVEVRISPDDEILVKGDNVTSGYWDDPVATAQALDAAGWYHTGDLGWLDDAGRLVLTGRLSERIVLASGLNVYPEDVENEIVKEPGVRECVVVAVDATAGRPKLHAVIIPEDFDTVSEEQMRGAIRHAGTRLAPHQRVAGITIWPQLDFPRTNVLKVKRHEVASAVATGVALPSRPARPIQLPSDEVVQQVAALLATVSGVAPDHIARSSDLEIDVGIDSLGQVELATLLEQQFGVVVSDGDLADLSTVDDLCDLITAQTHAEIPAPLPSWPRRAAGRLVRGVLQQLIVFPFHRLLARQFTVTGQENLRNLREPALLIANHSSHLDTPSLLRALPPGLRRRVAVAAAADYFYRSRWVAVPITLALGTFPFSRRGDVRASLEQCGDLVEDGWSVLVYPEGTRSISGEQAPFQSGIGLLAAELAVPVIPIGITGTHEIWPKGARWVRKGPVQVNFGVPITVAPAADRAALVAQLEDAVAGLVESA